MDTKQKDPSLTEQSTDPEKQSHDLGRICLICYCRPEKLQQDGFSYGDGVRCNFCLFLLDLDAESANKESSGAFVPRNLDMCFDSIILGLSGFCVLGSTLYLFGKERDVFSYNLPSTPTLTTECVRILPKDMLTDAHCPMKYAKSYPTGCQTPDGKLLVLSSLLHVRKENSGKFELFDPAEQEWTELPDLLPHLSNLISRKESDLSICVATYSFINNGPVLLVTTEPGDFTLDTDHPERGWSQCNEFRRARGLYFMLVRGRLCLMDWFAWEDDDGPGPYRTLSYPGISGLPDDVHCDNGMGMTWLSSDQATLKPHLVVDVCSFDPEDFERKEKNNVVESTTADNGEVPGMTVMERFKFVLGPQSKYCRPKFIPWSLFSVKTAAFD